MERFHVSIQRWIIPTAAALLFFWVLAFCIPYAESISGAKLSLGGFIRALCNFGSSDRTQASLDYTYCAFVPFIFAWLVYLQRDQLARAPIRGSNLALVLFGLGILLYWFGIRAEVQYFGYAALQILLAGVIIWFWGWKVFRILLFPWTFFAFAWPLPFLDASIGFPLRINICWLAGKLLPLVGVPLVQNGTAMLSPADPAHHLQQGDLFQIDVADPCSGIHSLFALVMFSALFAYLFVPRLWQQWVIFLSAFPLAIFGNLIRIMMLVVGSIWFGSNFAIGTTKDPSWFHEACGFVVYAVALGIEFFLASLLTRKWKRGPDDPSAETQPA